MKCINCGRVVTDDTTFTNEMIETLNSDGQIAIGNSSYEYDSSTDEVTFICPYCKTENKKSSQEFINDIVEGQTEAKEEAEQQAQQTTQSATNSGYIDIPDPTLLSLSMMKIDNYKSSLESFASGINGLAGILDGLDVDVSGIDGIATSVSKMLNTDSEIDIVYQQLNDTKTILDEKVYNGCFDLYAALGIIGLMGEDPINSDLYGMNLSATEKAELFHKMREQIEANKAKYTLSATGEGGKIATETYDNVVNTLSAFETILLTSGYNEATTLGEDYELPFLTQEDYFENVEKTTELIDQLSQEALIIKQIMEDFTTTTLNDGTEVTYGEARYQGYITEEEYQEALSAYLTDKAKELGYSKPLQDEYIGICESISLFQTIRDINYKLAFDCYMQADDFSEKTSNLIIGYEEREVIVPMIIDGGSDGEDIIINSMEEYADYLDKRIAENPQLFDEAWKNDQLRECSFETSLQIVFYDKNGNAVDDPYLQSLYMHENELNIDDIYNSNQWDVNSPQYNKIQDLRVTLDKNIFEYLSEDELNIIKYLYNINESDKLSSYKHFTTDLAFQRNGEEMASEVVAKIDEEYKKIGTVAGYTEVDAFAATCAILMDSGFKDGLNTFANGIDNLFHADGMVSADEYKTQFILSAINERYKDKGKLAQWISTGSYEVFNSVGNMFPSVLVSMIPGGKIFGLGLMGASATGNAREKGLQMGMDDGAAWMYGILNGMSETGLQYFLGGLVGLKGDNGFATKLSELLHIPNFLADMLAEGTEESLQSILEPMFATMVTGGKIPFQVDWNEVLKSGIYGMLTAGMINGGQIVIGTTAYTITTEMIPELLAEFKGHDMANIEELNKLAEHLQELNADELTWEDEIDDEINENDRMGKENYENLRRFIITDLKIKKLLIDLRPPLATDAINHDAIVKYTNNAYDSLRFITRELKRMIKPFDYTSTYSNKIDELSQVWFEKFIDCKTDIDKLNNFYQYMVTDMSESLVNSVKEECCGYSAFSSPSNSLKMCNSINELLHIMHSYIMNDTQILKSVNVIAEQKNNHGYSITLYGENNELAEGIFNNFPLDLDVGLTDIVSFGDIGKTIMMVRDRGHALSIEIDYDQDDIMVRYFIPKLCNIEMVNRLPGINKVKEDAPIFSGATGRFATTPENLIKDLFSFIYKVPADGDTLGFNDDVIDFFDNNKIDYASIMISDDAKLLRTCDLNSLVDAYGMYFDEEDVDVSVADILGRDDVDYGTNVLDTLETMFDSDGGGYQQRSLSMLDYSNGEEMIAGLSDSFRREPMHVREVEDGRYVMSTNGMHRYTVLRTHYFNELLNGETDQALLREKYVIPVQVSKINYFRTYSNYILQNYSNEIGDLWNVRDADGKLTEDVRLIFRGGTEKIVSEAELKGIVESVLAVTDGNYELLGIKESYDQYPSFKQYIDTNFPEFSEKLAGVDLYEEGDDIW